MSDLSTAPLALPVPRVSPVNQHPAVVAAHRRGSLLMAAPGLLGVVVAPFFVARFGVSALDLLLFASMYWLTQGLGLCAGYHRHFSHGAFEASRPVRALIAICGSMAAQGSLTYWVSVHRRHHEKSDREGDPHSPHQGRGVLAGLWHGHYGWTLSSGLPSPTHYCPDILRERALVAISRGYRWWVLLGLLLPTAAGGLLAGSWRGALGGLLWGGLLRLFVSSNSTWALNSICHRFGTRAYATRDESRNVAWLALPTMGESWHNNHHALPSAAAHGRRWWQLDVAFATIRGLELLGLVTKVSRPAR